MLNIFFVFFLFLTLKFILNCQIIDSRIWTKLLVVSDENAVFTGGGQTSEQVSLQNFGRFLDNHNPWTKRSKGSLMLSSTGCGHGDDL
jgi:hypothetical protein